MNFNNSCLMKCTGCGTEIDIVLSENSSLGYICCLKCSSLMEQVEVEELEMVSEEEKQELFNREKPSRTRRTQIRRWAFKRDGKEGGEF